MRLLNRVQKHEQRYVHGRYLEPMTLTYEAEDLTQKPVNDTVTFLCFPYFDLGQLLNPNRKSEDHTHPVRSLLQTQSRLESTLRRDESQVIQQTQSVPGRSQIMCIHVPQLWALIINKGTPYQILLYPSTHLLTRL